MRQAKYPWVTLGLLVVCAGSLVSQVVWLVVTRNPVIAPVLTLIGVLASLAWLGAAWRGRRLLRRHRAVVRLRPGWDVRTAVGDASLPGILGRLGAPTVPFPRDDYAVSVALGPDCVELWRGDEPVVVLTAAAERITRVAAQRVRVSALPVPGVVLDVGGEQINLAPIRREGGVWTARRAEVEAWAELIAQRVGAATGSGAASGRTAA